MVTPEVPGVVSVIESAIPVSTMRGPVVAVALAVTGMPRLVLVPDGMRVIPRRVPVCVVLVAICIVLVIVLVAICIVLVIVLIAICIVLVIALIIIVAHRIVLAGLALPRCRLTRRGMIRWA